MLLPLPVAKILQAAVRAPADDPAAKQQWLHALGWWCQDGERLAAIDAMYSAYCGVMRDRSCLEYTEQALPVDDGQGSAAAEAALPGVAAGAAGPAAQQSRRAGWKGWGSSKVQSMRRKMQERRGRSAAGSGDAPVPNSEPPAVERASAAAPGMAAVAARGRAGSALPSAAASPAKPELAPAELQSLDSIMEAKWMQSRKIQVGACPVELYAHAHMLLLFTRCLNGA